MAWTNLSLVVLCCHALAACGGDGHDAAARDGSTSTPDAAARDSASDSAKGRSADSAVDALHAVREASIDRFDASAQDATTLLDAGPGDTGGPPPPCPSEMVLIEGFCVDRYEAYLVDIGADAGELPHSPYDQVGDASVRAKSAANVVPQGYISQLEAATACENAGKRLCEMAEFALACRGPDAGNYYPYGGETHEPGDCNEGKGSEMPVLFGDNAADWTFEDFNDPRLNQIDGGLAKTGAYSKCVSPYGIYDCVGNLDEWGADPPDDAGHGRFRGGYYGDAEENGHGCLYVTSAHSVAYHDYSTGFRCCRDAATVE
jgi:hypothetical protein